MHAGLVHTTLPTGTPALKASPFTSEMEQQSRTYIPSALNLLTQAQPSSPEPLLLVPTSPLEDQNTPCKKELHACTLEMLNKHQPFTLTTTHPQTFLPQDTSLTFPMKEPLPLSSRPVLGYSGISSQRSMGQKFPWLEICDLAVCYVPCWHFP